MKLRVIEVKESVPKEGCYSSPPPCMDITHYVPQYYDERNGWCKCYLKSADTSRPTYYYHPEDAIAVCKEYAREHTPMVVWSEDTEDNKKQDY